MRMRIRIILGAVLLMGRPVFGAEQGLTLEAALRQAHAISPALKAARYRHEAELKRVGAAGQLKNPTLSLEAEGVGWDNDLFSEAEYGVVLSQKFKPSGRREAEREVALKHVEAAQFGEQAAALALSTEVKKTFYELFALQEIGQVRVEQMQLGEAFVAVAKQRLEQGAGSALEVVQAELALEEIILEQTCCFGDLEAVKELLSSLLGTTPEAIGPLRGAYYRLDEPATLIVDSSHPSLLRLRAEAAVAHASAAVAKASDRGDVELAGGYKHVADEQINSFIVSVEFTLPFRKTGALRSAAHLLQADALNAGYEAQRLDVQKQYGAAVAAYKGAKAEADLVKERLIPMAEEAYALSREGYEQGRFSWMELISAQQHLAEIRVRYIEALRDAHIAWAEATRYGKSVDPDGDQVSDEHTAQ